MNQGFLNWATPWMKIVRSHAVHDAIMAPALGVFPAARWGNYNDFVADAPERPFVWTREFWIFNTPAGQTIPADYSTPVLFGPPNYNQFLNDDDPDHHWGKPDRSTVFRRITEMQLDACAASYNGKPLAPWFPAVGTARNAPPPNGQGYQLTRHDVWRLLQKAWVRGCDEFNVFIQAEDASELHRRDKYAQTYGLCVDLAKLTEGMPVLSGTRTARTCRVFRR